MDDSPASSGEEDFETVLQNVQTSTRAQPQVRICVCICVHTLTVMCVVLLQVSPTTHPHSEVRHSIIVRVAERGKEEGGRGRREGGTIVLSYCSKQRKWWRTLCVISL